MLILDTRQIQQKIKRLAIQMVENNYAEKEIHLVGINTNGLRFARMLAAELENYPTVQVEVSNLKLNPKKPISEEVTLNRPLTDYRNKVVIIVDDVANTGRTTFFAFKPFMEVMTKKVEVAVLVNRKHKAFPIKVDYVGMSLATTLKDNIIVQLDKPTKLKAMLE